MGYVLVIGAFLFFVLETIGLINEFRKKKKSKKVESPVVNNEKEDIE